MLETTVLHDEERALLHFDRIRSFLEQRTGLRFKVLMAPDYVAASEDVRTGDADLALLSPQLVCRTLRWAPDLQYVATTRVSSRGCFYRAVVFSRRAAGSLPGAPPASLAKTRGQALALVSEESAAGYLFPLNRLLELGIDPFTHFRKIYLVGTHAAAVEAVLSGTVEVGAAYAEAVGQQPVTILASTEEIPATSLVASPFVDPHQVALLRAALLDPDYLPAVVGDRRPGPELAFPDFGWEVLPASAVDAPCEAAARLRQAQKASPVQP